jgi:hypothetical protein
MFTFLVLRSVEFEVHVLKLSDKTLENVGTPTLPKNRPRRYRYP